VVVLAGCETGRAEDHLVAGGVHVAGAFLVAGSQTVIAASTRVPDEVALTLSRSLYADPQALLQDPVRALQRAQLALRDAGQPASAWAGFRAWTR